GCGAADCWVMATPEVQLHLGKILRIPVYWNAVAGTRYDFVGQKRRAVTTRGWGVDGNDSARPCSNGGRPRPLPALVAGRAARPGAATGAGKSGRQDRDCRRPRRLPRARKHAW